MMARPWSEAERGRLLGHRDGLVTALIAVRRQIGEVQDRYRRTLPRHVNKLAERDAILYPLRELERRLLDKHHECQTAYDDKQFEAIVADGMQR